MPQRSIGVACPDVDTNWTIGSEEYHADTIVTRRGIFIFLRCPNSLVYVQCRTLNQIVVFAFDAYHGGYIIDSVNYQSGMVDVRVTEAGYAHSNQELYRIQFVDGVAICVRALTVDISAMRTSDPEEWFDYEVSLAADTLFTERVNNESERLETTSKTVVQYIPALNAFCTDTLYTDTLDIRSDAVEKSVPVQRTLPYIRLHRFEYVCIDETWYQRELGADRFFYPKYSYSITR